MVVSEDFWILKSLDFFSKIVFFLKIQGSSGNRILDWKRVNLIMCFNLYLFVCLIASYGHEKVQASDYNEMLRVATAGVNAIKSTTGNTFVAGQSSVLLCKHKLKGLILIYRVWFQIR